ncbi:ABC transporter ATP-binding protein [Mucilaginibacter achroorhodeus]|uniref:ABC transporter ATP-binding protein n=1 Tax=Mucilaginibacter achroorhodeus TaxID=2599294 RepID=A0A563U186_9SPHI|nr:ABC transporter ATP-binding protein [Mucilaginibacter achroorhodeus]TWR25374.1 ABC transporter ATP-binding protein [Mucilaginibacter achroorhodeus]
MGSKAIKIENLSKAYQVGDFSSGTISRDLERYWALLRGKEDPFLKIGETNDRTQAGESDIVWSLKDINLEIEQGDAVGIIGRNGAGKSTLLKILSRVTSPTTGNIKVKGRIASLLEVGTGFHPELTGRENIFLNGAILGMRKAEIKRKFDEIVSFAGIERYIDTPVKRYSSGMYVRLAFAVAAHLESEILIVDEVLAVGDAEFQKKCLGKMGDVSKGEGRTVLFVSHNMGLINQLCDTSAYLKSGQLVCFAKTKSVIDDYLLDRQNFKERLSVFFNAQESDDNVFLHGFEIIPHYQNQRSFDSGRQIELKFTFHIKNPIDGLRLGFELISRSTEQCIFRTFHDDSLSENQALQEGKYRMIAHIPACFLNEGQYIITPTIGIHNIKWLSFRDHQLLIEIINMTGINQLYSDSRPGYLAINLKWEIEHEKN